MKLRKSALAWLIAFIGLTLVIYYGQRGFKKMGKCEEAQQYIAERYKQEGNYSTAISDLKRIICLYPPKGMKVSPLEDRDKVTPGVIEMFKETERIKRKLSQMR